jgi:TetR/AcrR family transcriptional repressor of nem operon
VDVVAGQPRTHVKAIAELTRRLAACLRLAAEAGELAAGADCDQLSAFLWIGWEGAVP